MHVYVLILVLYSPFLLAILINFAFRIVTYICVHLTIDGSLNVYQIYMMITTRENGNKVFHHFRHLKRSHAVRTLSLLKVINLFVRFKVLFFNIYKTVQLMRRSDSSTIYITINYELMWIIKRTKCSTHVHRPSDANGMLWHVKINEFHCLKKHKITHIVTVPISKYLLTFA